MHLVALQEAYAADKFPKLTHLDISDNDDIIGQLHFLFFSHNDWNQLLKLNMYQTFFGQELTDSYRKDIDYLCSRVGNGCLPLIQEFRFNAVKGYFSALARVRWPSLTSIANIHTSKLLLPIVEMVEEDLMPNLTEVIGCNLDDPVLLVRLRRRGVFVYNCR